MLNISPKIFVCAELDRNIKAHYETIISCAKCGSIVNIEKVSNKNYKVSLRESLDIFYCLDCGEIYTPYKVEYDIDLI